MGRECLYRRAALQRASYKLWVVVVVVVVVVVMMALSKAMSYVVTLFVLLAASANEAAVFKVGDNAGWTIMGSPNYTAWATGKEFNVGDTLVFEYDKKFHNVMEVNKVDYKACNPGSPKETYATGNDSITLKRKGHHYFICGIPGHCALGQKVDIRIAKLESAPSPSVSPSPTPSVSPSGAPGSAPKGSDAPAGRCGVMLAAMFALASLAYFG